MLRPPNVEELKRYAKDEWSGISQMCLKLVENYTKWVWAVIQLKYTQQLELKIGGKGLIIVSSTV